MLTTAPMLRVNRRLLSLAACVAVVAITTGLSAQTNSPADPLSLEMMKPCGYGTPPPCATAPRAIYSPGPHYSKKARKEKVQGTVVLWAIVDREGRAKVIRVSRSVGSGLDEEAIKAVSKWKFEPGTSGGVPVPVQINVEVNFRLY